MSQEKANKRKRKVYVWNQTTKRKSSYYQVHNPHVNHRQTTCQHVTGEYQTEIAVIRNGTSPVPRRGSTPRHNRNGRTYQRKGCCDYGRKRRTSCYHDQSRKGLRTSTKGQREQSKLAYSP